jgi:hypothetical protein
MLTLRGYSWRHISARLLPVTTPNRAAIICNNKPKHVAVNNTPVFLSTKHVNSASSKAVKYARVHVRVTYR